MGPAGGLRQPVARQALHDTFKGRGKADFMAGGDIYRFDPGSGSKNDSDKFALVG